MKKRKTKIIVLCIFLPAIIFAFTGTFYYFSKAKPYLDFESAVEKNGFVDALNEFYPLSDEDLEKVSSFNKEKADFVDSLPQYDKNDTWDIYLYMCGSDLESCFYDNLSSAANFNVYLQKLKDNRNELGDSKFLYGSKELDSFAVLTSVLKENNMDFPDSFYDGGNDGNGGMVDGEQYDSDEEAIGSGSQDLMAITSTALPSNIRFIIQTGGSKKWTYPGINPNKIQRWIYDESGFNQLYEGPLENMGSQQGLENFLFFIEEENRKNHFTPDHKFFIFWNHGEGSFGAEYDEIFDDKLYLKEMRNAFNSVYILNDENPPFELLGFDACLMASAEAAKALSGIGKYYVASQDIEFGGWNYNSWINALGENPSINGAQLGKEIADSFIKLAVQQYSVYQDQQIPNHLGVYDLTKAGKVYDMYSDLIGEILKDSIENPGVIAKVSEAASNSIYYASNDYEYFNTCDLKIFMENISDLYPQAEKIINALDECTLYTRGLGHNAYSESLSVYYPGNINNLNSLFKSIDYINNVTDNFDVKTFYYYKSLGCLSNDYQLYLQSKGLPYGKPINTSSLKRLSNVNIIFNNQEACKNIMEIELYDGMADYIQSGKLVLAQYDDFFDKITYFGDTSLAQVKDNKIISDFSGKWLYIEDQPLYVELIDKNNNFERYRGLVELNGVQSHIICTKDLATGEIKISGIKDSSFPSDILARSIKPINKGDKIKPVYKTETGMWLQQNYDTGKTIKYKNNSQIISEKTLPDGKYLQFVEVSDIRGDVYNTPIVEIEIKNGEISSREISHDFVCF